MSASLVGSEMCIRDRFMPLRVCCQRIVVRASTPRGMLHALAGAGECVAHARCLAQAFAVSVA
eukprot:4644807-Alexandrium_andersonii.AAC.1